METGEKKISDYAVKILVAGSRNFSDYRFFTREVEHRLRLILRNIPRDQICFISGYGADDVM